MVDNNEQENYAEFKKANEMIYKKLKSIKVLSYDEFIAKDDKVVVRMSMKLTSKNSRAIIYHIILIATIKHGKIEKIGEVTYPTWDDSLLL